MPFELNTDIPLQMGQPPSPLSQMGQVLSLADMLSRIKTGQIGQQTAALTQTGIGIENQKAQLDLQKAQRDYNLRTQGFNLLQGLGRGQPAAAATPQQQMTSPTVVPTVTQAAAIPQPAATLKKSSDQLANHPYVQQYKNANPAIQSEIDRYNDITGRADIFENAIKNSDNPYQTRMALEAAGVSSKDLYAQGKEHAATAYDLARVVHLGTAGTEMTPQKLKLAAATIKGLGLTNVSSDEDKAQFFEENPWAQGKDIEDISKMAAAAEPVKQPAKPVGTSITGDPALDLITGVGKNKLPMYQPRTETGKATTRYNAGQAILDLASSGPLTGSAVQAAAIRSGIDPTKVASMWGGIAKGASRLFSDPQQMLSGPELNDFIRVIKSGMGSDSKVVLLSLKNSMRSFPSMSPNAKNAWEDVINHYTPSTAAIPEFVRDPKTGKLIRVN